MDAGDFLFCTGFLEGVLGIGAQLLPELFGGVLRLPELYLEGGPGLMWLVKSGRFLLLEVGVEFVVAEILPGELDEVGNLHHFREFLELRLVA